MAAAARRLAESADLNISQKKRSQSKQGDTNCQILETLENSNNEGSPTKWLYVSVLCFYSAVSATEALGVDSGHSIRTGSGSSCALGKHKEGDVTVLLLSEPHNSVNVTT